MRFAQCEPDTSSAIELGDCGVELSCRDFSIARFFAGQLGVDEYRQDRAAKRSFAEGG